MRNGMAQDDWETTVPSAHGNRSLVGMLVVLDIGERNLLRLESVTELSIKQLHRHLVTCPYLGDLVEQSVPLLFGPLMDDVLGPFPWLLCHTRIFAPYRPSHKRTRLGGQESVLRAAGDRGAPVIADRRGDGAAAESGWAISSSDFCSASRPRKAATTPPASITPAPMR